jgi:hypothetical protein
MWLFKNKAKKLKPKTGLDYFLIGIAHAQELKMKYPIPQRPSYTPSKIIKSTILK